MLSAFWTALPARAPLHGTGDISNVPPQRRTRLSLESSCDNGMSNLIVIASEFIPVTFRRSCISHVARAYAPCLAGSGGAEATTISYASFARRSLYANFISGEQVLDPRAEPGTGGCALLSRRSVHASLTCPRSRHVLFTHRSATQRRNG